MLMTKNSNADAYKLKQAGLDWFHDEFVRYEYDSISASNASYLNSTKISSNKKIYMYKSTDLERRSKKKKINNNNWALGTASVQSDQKF